MRNKPSKESKGAAQKKKRSFTYRQRLERHVTKKTIYIVECSLMSACEGEHEFEGPRLKDVIDEMIRDGWLDDFIVEDTINLACPACAQHCRDNVNDFEELDVRAGGKAS